MGREVYGDVPFGAERALSSLLLIIYYSRHFDQLGVSAFNVGYHTKKHLWPRMKKPLIYGYKHKYL